MLRYSSAAFLRSYGACLTATRCFCDQAMKYNPKPERLAQIAKSPSGWVPPSENPPDLGFSIRRSRTNNIPVYTNIRNSGTRIITSVRKVSGDLKALEMCLRYKLGDDKVYHINEITNCVKVKGNHKKELTKFLLELGF